MEARDDEVKNKLKVITVPLNAATTCDDYHIEGKKYLTFQVYVPVFDLVY